MFERRILNSVSSLMRSALRCLRVCLNSTEFSKPAEKGMLLCQLDSHTIKLSREGGKMFYYFMQIFLSAETKHIWFSRLKLL